MFKIKIKNSSIFKYCFKQYTRCLSQFLNSSEVLNETRNKHNSEKILFDECFRNQILVDLSSNDFNCIEFSKANKWFGKVVEYNVPHGKCNRGLSLVITYGLLSNHHQNSNSLQLARILGWCVEFFQSYFLVLDDLMDRSVTRRRQLCWYKNESVGFIACNDAVLLESSIYYLLKLHFSHLPTYINLLHIFMETSRLTAYGQCMDLLTISNGNKPELKTYTMDRYNAMVKFKTSYYSFVMPFRLAMYLANWSNKRDHEIVAKVLLKVGHLFQVQDDYLDCFGNSSVTGKIGTDIEEGKCCWPVVTALQLCDDRQKHILQSYYGQSNPESVRQVKAIYKQINLEEVYRNYEEKSYDELMQLINEISSITELPSNIFNEPFSQLYHRIK